jgi:DNA-binding IclR family transcriptional regulator
VLGSAETRKSEQREVGAVVHAITILRHLASATEPQGVAAVARATGVSPSTTFNILRTLARARIVAFSDERKTYGLGMGLAQLAAGLVGTSHGELIRPELERLALNYNMLIVLWRITEDGRLVLIDRAHSHTAVRVEMRKGLRLPYLVGAVGRCVAAALRLPENELRRRFTTLRWQSPPSFEVYLGDVERARADGWSIDDGHLYHGLVTVGSILTDQNEQPRFGISGITIKGQASPEILAQLGRELHEVARFAGRSLFPPRGTGPAAFAAE